VRALGDDCECGIDVDITNTCSMDLVASDFIFRVCERGSDIVYQCTTLNAQYLGKLDARLYETGPAEVNLTMQTERGEEKVTVRGNVTDYGSGCVCSVPGTSGHAPSSPGMLATCVLIGAALVRSCVRRARHYDAHKHSSYGVPQPNSSAISESGSARTRLQVPGQRLIMRPSAL
jgi:hypothetical protein